MLRALTWPAEALFARTGTFVGYACLCIALAIAVLLGFIIPAHLRLVVLIPACIASFYLTIGMMLHLGNDHTKVNNMFDAFERGRWDINTTNLSHAKQRNNLVLYVARLGERLGKLAQQIQQSADQLTGNGDQISHHAVLLSGRAEEIASMLEETASGLEEFASSIEVNASNCKEASGRADEATQGAQQALQGVNTLTGHVLKGREGIARVGDVMALIENIAFQTNMLALNASMEAARVGSAHGEAGRGFGVVAQQVRELAQKSADAVSTIRNTMAQLREQEDLALAHGNEAQTKMSAVVTSTGEAQRVIRDIAAASNEQGAGIAQIKIAVEQMSTLTQQNAAAVDDAARASKALVAENRDMVTAVGSFIASDYNNRDKLVTAAKRVQELVRQLGFDAACQVLSQKEHAFYAPLGSIGISVTRFDGVITASRLNPTRVGTNFSAIDDATMREGMARSLAAVKTQSFAWMEYAWNDAKTGGSKRRLGYAERLVGHDAFVNCSNTSDDA